MKALSVALLDCYSARQKKHPRREHRRLLLCASTEGASPFLAVCVDGESFAVVCALRESVFDRDVKTRKRSRWGSIKALPYTPLCSPHLISQPSSSASTGQPQQHVEELQYEVPTNPPQQQGTIDYTIVDSSVIIPRGRDPTDGKFWIQPCGESFHPSIQPVRVIRKKNFKWLPQYEDRIKACWNFKDDERFRGLMEEVRLA
ncbi:uncharacterized protein G2W53_044411 [Senna tora]|uniref:Uncharacterized protein n=1 Tax=Senna tora TaxID=362788 RepID=A0A834SHV0_9FABA|nr:uncharacterized protein G2W53_044411 [Senna tora]